MEGWVKFHREWLDNPIITKDKDYFAVWCYLMLTATHTEKRVQFGSEIITLKAGQIVTSFREIEKKLKIDKSKLTRIFTWLKNETLIDTVSNHLKTLVTIELWDTSQNQNETADETLPRQYQDTEQETEKEKEKRSKREKEKEKEINKNERMKENIYPSISPHRETSDEDFPLTEKELDRWLEEDDGIDEWDKCQIFYKNLNRGKQNCNSGQWSVFGGQELDDIDTENTYGFNSTNPIQQENKENIKLPPKPPSFAAGDLSALFDEFWKAYPKKVGKGYAYECFKKIKPSRKLVDIMLEAIAKQKKSDMWKRDKGQYIPNPSTWLNQKRWEDDLGGDTDSNPWSEFKLGIEL